MKIQVSILSSLLVTPVVLLAAQHVHASPATAPTAPQVAPAPAPAPSTPPASAPSAPGAQTPPTTAPSAPPVVAPSAPADSAPVQPGAAPIVDPNAPSPNPTTPAVGTQPSTAAPPASTPAEEPPPPPPSEEVPEGFVMEDLSEDPEALAKELQAGAVQATGEVGSVVGVVRGADGQPLIGAWIEVVGQSYTARSGVDGSFKLDLKPGTYELRVRMDGFSPRRVGDVEVKVGEKSNLDSTLVPLPGAVQTVVVAATINKEGESGRLIERQQSRATRDIMSREEMARSGGGSTSSVARRIVGTTVVGGRYLFVRGLGHRYGNTLMDGARIPSPDPDLRTVPLDLFPSAALSAINVQKTFTPDVPGDFTGGSVQLETRDMPERFTTNVLIGVGGNTETTFQKRVSSDGVGFADAFGFGNFKRDLPNSIPKHIRVGQVDRDPNTLKFLNTPQQVEKQGESLFARTKVTQDTKAPPDLRFNANIGNSWKVGHESRLGFFVASGYSNAYQTVFETIRRYSGAGGILADKAPLTAFQTVQTIHRTQLNGLGLIKFKIANRHRLSLTSLYTRDAENENRIFRGRISTSSDNLYTTRQRYIARSIWSTQLAGAHTFPKAKNLKWDWSGTYAQALRDDPAMRDTVYTDNDPSQLPTTQGSSTPPTMLYTKLNDTTITGSTNLSLPFKQWRRLDSLIKIGGWGENKDRTFDARRLRWFHTGEVPPGTGNFLTKKTIGGGPNAMDPAQQWYVTENASVTDSYRGSHSIASSYALLDLPLTWWARVTGGARVENSVIRLRPYNPYPLIKDTVPPALRLNDLDVLPALSLVFSPRKDMNIRFSGTKTIARPELRELARFRFTDFVGGFEYFGNPNLKSTRIWNADARWEWFPSAGEILAISAFAKFFDKPIETTIAQSTGQGLMTYRNAKSAINVGGELEFRKRLGFISEKIDFLAAGMNFAYIYSRVQLKPTRECSAEEVDCTEGSALDQSTSRNRPLQGQSPLVLNAFIDLDLNKTGTSSRLLYNTFGRRVDAISGFGLPDIYEESVHSVDLTASQVLWRIKPQYNDDGEQTNRSHQLRINLNAMNLANSPIRKTQGKQKAITYRGYRGAWFMISLDWGF